jgi:hypothetical protein
MQRYFSDKLLTKATSLLTMDALSDGWEYETHVCPTCGAESYTHKPGTGKPIKWPKGSIKFHKTNFADEAVRNCNTNTEERAHRANAQVEPKPPK